MNQPFAIFKSIPELSTPERLFTEWTQYTDAKCIPSVSPRALYDGDPNVFANISNFGQTIQSRFDFIHTLLSQPGPDLNYLLGFVNQTADLVFEVVSLYKTAQFKDIVKKYKSQNSDGYNFFFNNMEMAGESLLVELQRLKLHADFLANPGTAVPKFWNILNEMNQQIIGLLVQYINCLGQFCDAVCPFQRLSRILLNLESDEQHVANTQNTNQNHFSQNEAQNPYQNNNCNPYQNYNSPMQSNNVNGYQVNNRNPYNF